MAASATAPTKNRDKRSSAAGLSESDDERDEEFEGANVDNIQDNDELGVDFDRATDDEEDDELDEEFDGADVDNDQDDDDEDDTSVDKGDSLLDPNADDTEADLAAMLKARLGTSDDDEKPRARNAHRYLLDNRLSKRTTTSRCNPVKVPSGSVPRVFSLSIRLRRRPRHALTVGLIAPPSLLLDSSGGI